jgi:hypothetical protein
MKKAFLLLAGLLMSGLSAHAQTALTPVETLAPEMFTTVELSASFANDPKPIRSGLMWRIYEEKNDGAIKPPLKQLNMAIPSVALPIGDYVVHVTYGLASASRPLKVRKLPPNERQLEKLTLNAGALKLNAAMSGDIPIPPEQLRFSLYVPLPQNSEGRLVAENIRANAVVRLPEGVYHVVSAYGDSNAIARTDVRVETGKLIEATLNHRAATVVLKLVAELGKEAIAGTTFSILTPGGDSIREETGAFPSITLSEGEYSVIARNNGKVYQTTFRVESGRNRDVEVLTKE